MKYFRLLLLLFLAVFPAYSVASPTHNGSATASATAISGQVFVKGKTPMQNGIVLLFNKDMGPAPSRDSYWRVPDMITGTDNGGRFSIQVSRGTYYLQVAQKNPDGEIGPPKETEYFYFHGDIQGRPLPIVVTSGNYNLGVLKAFPFTPGMVQREKGITSIEGVVLDNEGSPVEKALVFVYLSEQAMGRPTFISERTDKNGRYVLRVHDGGTFYLKVRSVYGGGAPQEGEFLNITNEFTPHKVSLEKHQKLKGVTLKVLKFSRPGSGSGSVVPPPPEKVWKNIGELQGQ